MSSSSSIFFFFYIDWGYLYINLYITGSVAVGCYLLWIFGMSKINKKKMRYAVVMFAAALCVLLVDIYIYIYIYIYSLNGPI